jgi:predicted nucleic acid-binding protein
MKKPLIYLDTSVISYLEQKDAPERMIETRLFWERVKARDYNVAISEVTIKELEQSVEPKKTLFEKHLNDIVYECIKPSSEIEVLAQQFIEHNILKPKSIDDCRHIAYSIIYNCDIIVSWNFKHIVNYKTINGVKLISLMTGYRELAIYTPAMLVVSDDDGGENDDP